MRAFCFGVLGRYDGNHANLSQLSSLDEAEKFSSLVGGIYILMTAFRKSTEHGEYPRSLQMLDRIDAIFAVIESDYVTKIAALEELESQRINAPERNQYLSSETDLAKDLAN